MSRDNRLRGTERIRGELLKLGIRLAPAIRATPATLMRTRAQPAQCPGRDVGLAYTYELRAIIVYLHGLT
jgi:hypothetical protein